MDTFPSSACSLLHVWSEAEGRVWMLNHFPVIMVCLLKLDLLGCTWHTHTHAGSDASQILSSHVCSKMVRSLEKSALLFGLIESEVEPISFITFIIRSKSSNWLSGLENFQIFLEMKTWMVLLVSVKPWDCTHFDNLMFQHRVSFSTNGYYW